ncbi:hypothetical protein NC653_026716 [Populus alba x Populus x berolinensis]|uniref:Uncharacterized protein n=1 Tax=Populus alba x Populus x berolinensis TaxID=444605 RepID=A0AAD6M3N9_9ROSI|nr:hypothetical protein NC653_026716 [Populus alba x Populus x berolinensis]
MVEPGLLVVVAASFRCDCRQHRKWWPAGWSIFLLCFLCCWKGRIASADSTTMAEELELAMTAPLLVLVPSVEKKTQLLLVMGKRYRRLGCVAGVETRLVAILDCCCD